MHIKGDVVDAFGFIDSYLEKNLELVVIPNMTEIEYSFQELFKKAADKHKSKQIEINEIFKEAQNSADVAEKIIKDIPWYAAISGRKGMCFETRANHNITIYWSCHI